MPSASRMPSSTATIAMPYRSASATVAGIASVSPLYASWQDFFWKDPAGDKVYMVQAFAFDPDRPVFLMPEVEAQRARLEAEHGNLRTARFGAAE